MADFAERQRLIYDDAYEAFMAARTGRAQFSPVTTQDESWTTFLTVWYYLGCFVGFPLLAWGLWGELNDQRPNWQAEVAELFGLPERANIWPIVQEISICIAIRLWQLLCLVITRPVSLGWTILTASYAFLARAVSAAIATTNALAIDTRAWYHYHPISDLVTYWLQRARAIRYRLFRHPRRILLGMAAGTIAFLVLSTLRPWVPIVGWAKETLSRWSQPDELIPTEFLLSKTPLPSPSKQLQEPYRREVPTAQVIGMDVPILIPAPTLGMRRPEQVVGSTAKTIIVGTDNVYCSKCKQWHCCELPY